MNKGWRKQHRKIWDNPIFRNPRRIAVWMWLLDHAAWVHPNNKKEYEPTSVCFQEKRITLMPGQLTVGATQIGKDTGVKSKTVARILNLFRDEEMIEKQGSNHCSLITIKNWTLYQPDEEQFEEQTRSSRVTSEELPRTNKEEKTKEQEETIVVGSQSEPTPAQYNRDFFSGGSAYQKERDFFLQKVPQEVLDRELQKFVLYWTEPNKSGTKTAWEGKTTFDVHRRLFTWLQRAGEDYQKRGGSLTIPEGL